MVVTIGTQPLTGKTALVRAIEEPVGAALTDALRAGGARTLRCSPGDDYLGAVASAARASGRLDILVNYAGEPSRLGGWRSPKDVLRHADWTIHDIRAITQACLPSMPRGSSVINVCGVRPAEPDNEGVMVRTAITSATRSLAHDCRRLGVRVNALVPGYFEPCVAVEGLVARIPARRFGRLEELGSVVVYFASDDATWFSGAVLPVDGGLGAPR